jgi:hypothetical protein
MERYTLLILQTQSIRNIQRYETIKINPDKAPNEEQFPMDKIYVLAAHEEDLQRET